MRARLLGVRPVDLSRVLGFADIVTPMMRWVAPNALAAAHAATTAAATRQVATLVAPRLGPIVSPPVLPAVVHRAAVAALTPPPLPIMDVIGPAVPQHVRLAFSSPLLGSLPRSCRLGRRPGCWPR